MTRQSAACPLLIGPESIARASWTVPAGVTLERAVVESYFTDDGAGANAALMLVRIGGEFDPASREPLPRDAEVYVDIQNGTRRAIRVSVVLVWARP